MDQRSSLDFLDNQRKKSEIFSMQLKSRHQPSSLSMSLIASLASVRMPLKIWKLELLPSLPPV